MKEFVATVTQRGQVTVPAAIRRLLGTKTGDKLAFQVEDGQVRIEKASMTLREAFASVKPAAPPEEFKRIEREAKEEHVARQLEKLRDR